jgi:hypothetical protein
MAAPRFRPELNTTYRAPVTGYLSVYKGTAQGIAQQLASRLGGGEVRLLVGVENPPTECVGRMNDSTQGDPRSCGAVIREGEFFVADAGGKQPQVECVFTPLF